MPYGEDYYTQLGEGEEWNPDKRKYAWDVYRGRSEETWRRLREMMATQWGLTPELQKKQYGMATSRLDPLYTQQRRGVSDRLASWGFGGGSGAEWRGIQNVNRQQAQTYGDISGNISIQSMLAGQKGSIAGQALMQQLLGGSADMWKFESSAFGEDDDDGGFDWGALGNIGLSIASILSMFSGSGGDKKEKEEGYQVGGEW